MKNNFSNCVKSFHLLFFTHSEIEFSLEFNFHSKNKNRKPDIIYLKKRNSKSSWPWQRVSKKTFLLLVSFLVFCYNYVFMANLDNSLI